MKVLVVYPPLMKPISVYGSLPVLLGQLETAGINAAVLDLNVEFLKEILSNSYLKKTKENLDEIYKNVNLSLEYKKRLKDYLCDNLEETSYFIERADELYSILISQNPTIEQVKMLKRAFDFLFLPYPSSKVIFDSESVHLNEINSKYSNNYSSLMKRISSSQDNIFYSFFEEYFNKFDFSIYDVIAISVPFEHNLCAALTLSKLIKQKTNAKVILGGVLISATQNTYIKYHNMFNNIFDALLVGDAKKSIVNYVKYLQQEISVEEVFGLITKINGKIVVNDIDNSIDCSLVSNISFTGINFNNYKDQIIPLEFSSGCYWGRCSFCYSNYQKKYYIVSPKQAVDIIQNLKNKYNINNFMINDDAINLNFLSRFADELISRNLNISYHCFLRFEKELSRDLIIRLKESGLVSVFLGLESASSRILKLMNKGIDLNVAERILVDFSELEIYTTVSFLYGFPTEDKSDILKTIDFIKKNLKYISTPVYSYFTVLKGSRILNLKNELNISNFVDIEEFSNYLIHDYSNFRERSKELTKLLLENGLPKVRSILSK